MPDSLGDRQKSYENVNRSYLVKKVPVICRVDGRSFHTWAKGLEKPFSQDLIDCMAESAMQVMKDMSGCAACYVQSDEATFLLTDYRSIETQAWFDYNVNKVVSMSAALMTAFFNENKKKYVTLKDKPLAFFDSRCFNIPKEDVINNLLWRKKDFDRNSLSMYCSSLFSHKQLQGKNREQQHEMLYSIGKNWATDLSNVEKNGTFIIQMGDGSLQIKDDVLPTYESIKKVFADSGNPCLLF